MGKVAASFALTNTKGTCCQKSLAQPVAADEPASNTTRPNCLKLHDKIMETLRSATESCSNSAHTPRCEQDLLAERFESAPARCGTVSSMIDGIHQSAAQLTPVRKSTLMWPDVAALSHACGIPHVAKDDIRTKAEAPSRDRQKATFSAQGGCQAEVCSAADGCGLH